LWGAEPAALRLARSLWHDPRTKQKQSGRRLQTFVQNHLGLVIVSAITVLAALVLTTVSYQLRAAGMPLRPIAYLAVLFALALVPQLAGHLAMAVWPKPDPVLDAASFAGREAFDHPERIFGTDVDADLLRDAKELFPELLAKAEVAQLRMRETGEMTLAARFACAEDAKESSARFWTAFALTGTSGSEENGWWGKRGHIGDVVHLKRMETGLAIWIGPTKEAVRKLLADVRIVTTPPDLRPGWIRIFDSALVKVASLLLLVALFAGWFFKGAGWAGRIDGEGPALSAAEVSRRLSQLNDVESFRQIAENQWELIVRYETTGEVGRYRYVMRLDPENHRVLVTEYLSRRISPSGSYNWHKSTGITFFRTGAGVDLQRHKRPIVEAVTSAGWDWQPVMWNVPAFSQ
jgi:hypothetical protein